MCLLVVLSFVALACAAFPQARDEELRTFESEDARLRNKFWEYIEHTEEMGRYGISSFDIPLEIREGDMGILEGILEELREKGYLARRWPVHFGPHSSTDYVCFVVVRFGFVSVEADDETILRADDVPHKDWLPDGFNEYKRPRCDLPKEIPEGFGPRNPFSFTCEGPFGRIDHYYWRPHMEADPEDFPQSDFSASL